MRKNLSPASEIRLAEVVAALSLATDLGMGQPLDYATRSCVFSVRLGESLGLSESELSEVYYLALLRYLGCNAGTHEQAALVGDELALRAATLPVFTGQQSQFMEALVGHMRTTYRGLSPTDFDQLMAQIFMALPQEMQESSA